MTPGLKELLQYWLSLTNHSPVGYSVCRKSFHSQHSGLRAAKQLLKLLRNLGIYITIQLEKLYHQLMPRGQHRQRCFCFLTFECVCERFMNNKWQENSQAASLVQCAFAEKLWISQRVKIKNVCVQRSHGEAVPHNPFNLFQKECIKSPPNIQGQRQIG